MMTALVVTVLWCCSSVALSLVLGPVLARQLPPDECHSDWLGAQDQHRFGALRGRPRVLLAIARTAPNDIW